MDRNKQVNFLLASIQAVTLTIRRLGEVPGGHLYAQFMGVLDLQTYERIIGILKAGGHVSERGHLLTWTGPAMVESPVEQAA